MKNERTPRTLADCEFTVGHRQAVQRSGAALDLVIGLVGIAGAISLVVLVTVGVI